MDHGGKQHCLFRGEGEIQPRFVQFQFQHQEVALCAEDAIDTCIERNSLVDTLHQMATRTCTRLDDRLVPP
jgi:hypothetical protein